MSGTSRMVESSSRVRPFRHLLDEDRLRAGNYHVTDVESAIPTWFLWTADALAMGAALLVNLALAPSLQRLVAPGGALRVEALSWLGLPGSQLDSSAFFPEYFGLLLVTVPVTLVTIGLLGGYELIESQSRLRILGSTIIGAFVGLGAFVLVVFTLHQSRASRIFVFGYVALSIVALAGHRFTLRTYKLRRLAAGRYARKTAFVGRPDDVVRLIEGLPAIHSTSAYRLVGYFTTGEPLTGSTELPALGSVEHVAATLVHTPINLVIVVLPDRSAPWLAEVVRACDYLRVTVQIVPTSLVELTPKLQDLRVLSPGSPTPLPGIVLQPWKVDAGALFLKRLADLCLASMLLLLLSPLFLIIAVAIKIMMPKQDVFYRWRVIGYHGRPFTGYKFTTMVADADQRRADLLVRNEMTGPVFKIKDDPRVTPLGKVLRKFSLNELPQLWSVVVGDMSLVGPRPAGAWEIGAYEDWHKRKLSFRPGMTCLWQVRGRNKISSFDDWVRMDLEYIDNWSLWLDLRILVRTAWAVVKGTGS